ncbi:hypothetical protein GCM10009624_05580 [Gordonia sinesedis]
MNTSRGSGTDGSSHDSSGSDRSGSGRPVVVVDAANVVGSVPDGWWRDRQGATERLRDRIAPFAESGVGDVRGPVTLILVTEGKARGVGETPGVTIVEARGSGDDTIVDVVREHQGTPTTVVTADRGLISRVRDLGANVVGPSVFPR